MAKKEDIAAFVYEPLVQGAAAMKMHSAVALDEILKNGQSFEHNINCR